jgi:hypothetical protein
MFCIINARLRVEFVIMAPLTTHASMHQRGHLEMVSTACRIPPGAEHVHHRLGPISTAVTLVPLRTACGFDAGGCDRVRRGVRLRSRVRANHDG